MGSQPPICQIQPPGPTFDTTAPQLPSIPLISLNTQGWNIPQAAAAQLQMMALAINSLRDAVYGLTNRGAAPNNMTGGLIGGGGAGGGGVSSSSPSKSTNTNPPSQQQQKQQKKQGAGLVEVGRTTTKVKVTNPDDTSQYVIVNQITQLVLRDPVSGETWNWNQGADLNQNSP